MRKTRKWAEIPRYHWQKHEWQKNEEVKNRALLRDAVGASVTERGAEAVPPKGGTLTATGATSPNARDSRSLLESP